VPTLRTLCDAWPPAGVKSVVDDVLQGFNGTVMAYGQTGGEGMRVGAPRLPMRPMRIIPPVHPRLASLRTAWR